MDQVHRRVLKQAHPSWRQPGCERTDRIDLDAIDTFSNRIDTTRQGQYSKGEIKARLDSGRSGQGGNYWQARKGKETGNAGATDD